MVDRITLVAAKLSDTSTNLHDTYSVLVSVGSSWTSQSRRRTFCYIAMCVCGRMIFSLEAPTSTVNTGELNENARQTGGQRNS